MLQLAIARPPLALVLCACFAAFPALAGPKGLVEIEGGVSLAQDGSHTEITTQSELSRAGFTDGFDIAPDESVWVAQPSEASSFFAEDWSADASQIDGALGSNGVVGVINPFGVFIGESALVDVAGLVAAAGRIDEEALRAGEYRFDELSGEVAVAEGARIEAAQSVLLAGRRVANYGHIRVPDGAIVLAAGDRLTLASAEGRILVRADGLVTDPGDYAVRQEGSLDAGFVSLTAGDGYSLAMNHTGITRGRDIQLDGGGTGLVEVGGVLDAGDATAGAVGGAISVEGQRIALRGRLEASGHSGGGAIRVGGDVRGEGPLANARRSYVADTARLRANALRAGDGGSVVVYAEEHTGFYGEITARGGAEGGDGGFAEISGAGLEFGGRVALGAPAGRSGALLLDPVDIEIQGSGAGEAPGVELGAQHRVLFGETGAEPFVIREATLESGDIDGDVILEATHSIVATGSFDAGDEAGVVELPPGVGLTLRTRNSPGDEGSSARAAGIDLDGVDGEDLSGLTWRTTRHTAGGEVLGRADLVLETGVGGNSGEASIVFGRLVADGGSVSITTDDGSVSGGAIRAEGLFAFNGTTSDEAVRVDVDNGDIAIADIEAASDPANPDDLGVSGPIRIDIDEAGDLAIGSIRTEGGPRNTATNVARGVEIQVTSGDIAVDEIVTTAPGGEDPLLATADAPRRAAFGGTVDVRAEAGNLTIRRIETRGGDAFALAPDQEDSNLANGDGGNGGGVLISAIGDGEPGGTGHVGVAAGGEIDTRGGTGSVAEIDQRGIDVLAGRGGNGGNVQISGSGSVSLGGPITASGGDSEAVAGVDPDTSLFVAQLIAVGGTGGTVDFDGGGMDAAETPEVEPANPVQVLADITSQGGAGRGSVSVPDPAGGDVDFDLGVAGGTGGSVQIGGNGEILVGAADDPVLIQASGGPSEAGNGGPAQRAFESILVGHSVNSLLSSGDATLYGQLVAKGGDGEDGGAGGIVAVRSTIASVRHLDAASNAVASPDLAALGLGELDAVLVADGGSSAGEGFLVELEADSASFLFEDNGGNAGTVDVLGSELVLAGAASARGGSSSSGAGGDGGAITITSTGEAILATSGLLDVSGGGGAGDPGLGSRDGEATPFVTGLHEIQAGGGGGSIALNAERGSVSLLGGARGADGVADHPAASDGQPGALQVRAGGDVDLQQIGDIGFASVTQLDREADSGLSTALGGSLQVSGVADPSAADVFQTVAAFETPDGDTALSYSLLAAADEDLMETEAPQIDIVLGAVSGTLGSVGTSENSHSIINASGDIRGQAATTHLSLAGSLLLSAENIGRGAPVVVDGAGGTLRLLAGGDTDGAGGEIEIIATDMGGGLAGIEVEQREFGAATDIGLLTGGGAAEFIEIAPDGDRMRVSELDTASYGASFAYTLADTRGLVFPQPEGDLDVAPSGGALGGDLLLQAQGAIRLAADAIEAGDHTVALVAAGPIGAVAGAEAAVTVDDPGALLLVAGPAEGQPVAHASLVVTSDDGLTLSALTEGDLSLTQSGATTGDVVITRVEPDIGFVQDSPSGVLAGGDVLLRTGADRAIVLGPSLTDLPITVTSGGDQTYGAGAIRIGNERTTPLNQQRNDASIESAGDVLFEGGIDTAPGQIPARLRIAAARTTRFGGDVGGAEALQRLEVTDVDLAPVGPGDTRRFEVGEGVFLGAIDGAASAVFVTNPAAVDAPEDERLRFGGNIGAKTPLEGFRADSRVVTFTDADSVRTGAGGILLNTLSAPAADVAGVTLGDRVGNLTLTSEGDIEVGHKLSAVGNLRLRSDTRVAVGDLTANTIAIQAPRIELALRPPGELDVDQGVDEDGNLVVTTEMDDGVDWVANQINTSSPIALLPSGSGLDGPPKLVIGSGGVRVPGDLREFDVVRLDAGRREVTADRILASDGRTLLDLTAEAGAPSVIGDPNQEIERESPMVFPAEDARLDSAPPLPPPSASAPEVLAWVRCGAEACAPGDASLLFAAASATRGPLATERAQEIASLYRELLADREGRVRLRARFAVAGRAYRQRGGRYRDGDAFYSFLESSPHHAQARREVDTLAELLAQVDLLGLSAADTRAVQEAIATSFAEAVALPGFDTRATLAAVDASPVGLLD